jgi:1-acyl-sn-glycerol-3-phosphate acyltransferase
LTDLLVFLAFLRTTAAVVSVAVYVLLVGPPALLWTLVVRDPRFLYAAGSLALRLGLGLAGITVRVVGAERMQADRPVVYAANHSSNVEPPAVFFALRRVFPRLRVLYKAELRKLPVLVWVFDMGGFVPIERGNRDQSFPAVDRAAKALGAGASFLIFPEGTRSRTGDLLPFKKGGFLMAIKAQAPIVPLAVSGGREAMRKGGMVIWPTTVTVTICPAVETAGLTVDDRDAVVADVRAAIARGLAAG